MLAFIIVLLFEKIKLEEETCFQKSVWQYPELQEIDQENSSGRTPKLTYPTQLPDTPQEEALGINLWEFPKNPNYTGFDQEGHKKDRRWFLGHNTASLIIVTF